MTELEEVVKALRWLSKVRTYCNTHMIICRECEFHGFCTDPDSEESCGKYHEAHKGACDGCRWKRG